MKIFIFALISMISSFVGELYSDPGITIEVDIFIPDYPRPGDDIN